MSLHLLDDTPARFAERHNVFEDVLAAVLLQLDLR
jgi:hypothetical protein